ncbi:MAG: hypothetical protein AAFY35_18765 [Pseudomonadota bacterium]
MSVSPYEALLHDVCVRLGFCGGMVDGKPSHVSDFIPDEGSVSAKQFSNWVFLAEGMEEPLSQPFIDMKRDIERLFVKHLSAEAVDVSILKICTHKKRQMQRSGQG